MTKVTDLAARAARLAGAAHYAQRLIEALGDPTAWRYTGRTVDHGPDALRRIEPPRCVCGHPVRWHYEVALTRDIPGHQAPPQTLWVGSVCVQQIAHVAPELAADIARAAAEAERAWREAQAQARRAQAEAARHEAERAWREAMDRALAEYQRYRASGRRAPYELWAAVASDRYSLPRRPPEYQRVADYVRWYRTQAARWAAALTATS